MRFCRSATVLAAALAWALLIGAALVPAGPAAAQPASGARVGFEINVVQVSPEPGGVAGDARARRFDQLLGRKLRYESLRVLETTRREVALDTTESVALPNGRTLRFRPLDRAETGVLVAVDLDDTAQGDFRIPKGKPVILGGQAYQGGQLFVVLEVRD